MDIIIFKLAILLVPGFMTLHTIKTFSGVPLAEKRSLSTYDLLLILLFSLFGAAIYDLFSRSRKSATGFSVFDWITKFSEDSVNPYTVKIFLILMGINIVLGLLFALFNTHHIFYRVLSKCHITNQFGREDIWSIFTSYEAKNEWVVVRDFALKYSYVGKIYMTSETFERRELILRDVQVHSLRGANFLYQSELMYLSLTDGQYSIKIKPGKPKGVTNVKKENQNG